MVERKFNFSVVKFGSVGHLNDTLSPLINHSNVSRSLLLMFESEEAWTLEAVHQFARLRNAFKIDENFDRLNEIKIYEKIFTAR